jgi:GTP-dependent phosphoenolpyruvate carboxykinase
VGDDIAWMHVTPDGSLNAINPENGIEWFYLFIIIFIVHVN